MEVLVQLNQMVDEIFAKTLAFGSIEEASETAGLVEVLQRKLDAFAVEIVDKVDRSALYKHDGHSNVRSWSAFTCRTSSAEASRRFSLAEAFRQLPTTAGRYRAGDVGREQVGRIATACGSNRYGHLVIESEEALLADERTLTAREFGIYMNRWCQIADIDGVKQRHDTAHEFRALRIFEQFDGGWKLDGRFGPAQGAAIKELLEGFTENERLADWDQARQVHGDKTNFSHLARTDNQRRADALEAGLSQGAAQPPDAVRPEPLVHIVMSQDAFDHALAELAGEPTVKLDPRNYRCETLGGTQLHPSEALAAAMAGHIRRVVLGAKDASVSQRTRLFTGALRDLLNVIDPMCMWAGCEIPGHRCQADHTIPWSWGGPTDVSNGKPMCGRHNRLKEHGYRTWRDPQGRWHTNRPNGTEIQPAA